MAKKISRCVFTGIILLLTVLILQICHYAAVLPDKFSRSSDAELEINGAVRITAVRNYGADIPAASGCGGSEKNTLLLYGFIPIKTVDVETVGVPELVPLGQPFGLKINTNGVIVTDFGNVDGTDGKRSPAKEGGIVIGDIIVSVNGQEIKSSDELLGAVQLDCGKTLVTVQRGEELLELTLTPEKSRLDGNLKLGMWTRDSCAGIGTLTFYDSERGVYGGLGHPVCDSITGQVLPLYQGSAVPVCINEVKKGVNGQPGELGGIFLTADSWGTLELNTECGVFGRMEICPSSAKSVPMAFKQEICIGEATILCTLDGTTPCEYSVVIEKISYNSDSAVKNMTIRIIDERLLSIAGGIVQGMSGSPIIQNGKLVGAVTHVFVNDITRGYAIFAENMYNTSVQLEKTALSAA